MKDPAFLFYPSDFLTGTIFFSNEELGLFIKLLCVQHQHEGRIKIHDFDTICTEKYEKVRQKFTKDDNGYYNKRLEIEIAKRKRSADVSRGNGKLGGRPSGAKKPTGFIQVSKKKPKQNLSIDINRDRNTSEFKMVYPFDSEKFKSVWEQFIQFRASIKKPLKEISQQAQLKILSEYSEQEATDMILQSIANGWQGIFKINQSNNKNGTNRKSKLEEMAEAIRQSDEAIDAKYARKLF